MSGDSNESGQVSHQQIFRSLNNLQDDVSSIRETLQEISALSIKMDNQEQKLADVSTELKEKEGRLRTLELWKASREGQMHNSFSQKDILNYIIVALSSVFVTGVGGYLVYALTKSGGG